jgi:hypothetical protein
LLSEGEDSSATQKNDPQAAALGADPAGNRIELARIIQRFHRFRAGTVLRAFTSPGARITPADLHRISGATGR